MSHQNSELKQIYGDHSRPEFMKGNPQMRLLNNQGFKDKYHMYHNLGYGPTSINGPYPGKVGKCDWGPPQGGGIYYDQNGDQRRTYVYPLYSIIPQHELVRKRSTVNTYSPVYQY
jgi:hypothetical protein